MSEAIPTAETAAPSRVLLVDDEPNVLSALRRSLRGRGFEVVIANSGEEALAVMQRQPVDAIVSDMRMPGMSGAELLKASLTLAPDAVRVLLTGYADIGSAVQAVNEGEIFRYLAKPWDDTFLHQVLRDGLARKALERERDALVVLTDQQNEALRRLNAGLEEQVALRTLALKNDFTNTVRLLSSLIEPRAGLTARCPRAVARHVRLVGPLLDITGDALNDLGFAALLQDVGKLALPDALVRRPLETLQSHERSRMLRHPLVGESSLMALQSLQGAGAVLRHVNENIDGSGTPGEARGDEIPLASRLLRVASDFEHWLAGAIESIALTPEQAYRRLRQYRGTRYDARVVDAFLQAMDQPVQDPARKRLLSSENLRPGLQLGQDLMSPSGALLLSQGERLDGEHIAHIRRIEAFSGEFLWVAVTHDEACEATA
jgi:response regulator RpfG family c-di-GMP phosphodiesterase